MEYLFVHDKQGGWWLKIDSVEKLIDYHQKPTTDMRAHYRCIYKGKDRKK